MLSTANLAPVGNGWQASTVAAPSRSVRLSTAITPAWRNSASRVTAGVAVAAVCEAAARRATSDVPDRTASTGLVRPSRRAIRANLRGLPNDSRYSTATRVAASRSHHISRSLLLTSYLSPVETNVETPSPMWASCSSNAIPTPPDWVATPIGPGGGSRRANVASTV